jgi:DNA adenine methylase
MYHGGKWRIAPWIISHFPRHKHYLEPCGGAASVLLQKDRSGLETYNDLDGQVVNFFRVLRSQPHELLEQVRLTPWARAEYELAWTPSPDPLENARRFFVCSWMSISNMAFDGHSGFRTVSYFGQKGTSHADSFRSLVTGDHLLKIARRLAGVQIENRDYRYIIERYDHPETLIYFDPPYVHSERTTSNNYIHEWSDADHIEAAWRLHATQSMVVISGYRSPLYRELYESRGWVRTDMKTEGNAGANRIESLWSSPRTNAAWAGG